MSVAEPRSVPEHAAPSQQSLLALSWLNFSLSGMQTAFGPIVAAYLVVQGWIAEDIGFALSIGGTANFVSQVPGGELVDEVRSKRLLVAAGVVAIGLNVLILWLSPAVPAASRHKDGHLSPYCFAWSRYRSRTVSYPRQR